MEQCWEKKRVEKEISKLRMSNAGEKTKHSGKSVSSGRFVRKERKRRKKKRGKGSQCGNDQKK